MYTLGELIKYLEKQNPNQILPFGFKNPHSYRGYYDQLAFEPAENIKVSEMLACAREALGKTYTGWKGGENKMEEYTEVWLSEIGECSGQTIAEPLLDLMFGNIGSES